MSDSDVPVVLAIKSDATNGEDAAILGILRNDTFARSAAIDIGYDPTKGKYRVEFKLRDELGPLLKARPAWISLDPSAVLEIVQKCRQTWEDAFAETQVQVLKADGTNRARYPFEEKAENPVDEDQFNRLAAKLALAGERLFESIFERDKKTALDDVAKKIRAWASFGPQALTIESDQFHIPWRMIYTHPTDAGRLARDGSNFVPNGFWGNRHIMEQFPEDFRVRDFRIKVQDQVLTLGSALSVDIDKKFGVPCVAQHQDLVLSYGNRISAKEWTDVAALGTALGENPFPYQLLYMLCHAEGAGSRTDPNFLPFIEIAGKRMFVDDIRHAIIGFENDGPLVFLNACRGGQYGTLVSHNFSFASEFIRQGAKGFLGAQIEVPAVFAGHFGALFLGKLLEGKGPNRFLGHVLRDATWEMWEKRNPLALVYSLYAGADCHVIWDQEKVA